MPVNRSLRDVVAADTGGGGPLGDPYVVRRGGYAVALFLSDPPVDHTVRIYRRGTSGWVRLAASDGSELVWCARRAVVPSRRQRGVGAMVVPVAPAVGAVVVRDGPRVTRIPLVRPRLALYVNWTAPVDWQPAVER